MRLQHCAVAAAGIMLPVLVFETVVWLDMKHGPRPQLHSGTFMLCDHTFAFVKEVLAQVPRYSTDTNVRTSFSRLLQHMSTDTSLQDGGRMLPRMIDKNANITIAQHTQYIAMFLLLYGARL